MNITRPFIRRPVATILLAIALMMGGIISYFNLPLMPLPQMSVPVIFVEASLPGASPETMASSVATPLQRALGAISGVDSISASSSEGSTLIFITFDIRKDEDTAAREVQAAINTARPLLPSGMRTPPIFRRINPASIPIMALALTSDTYDQGTLYDLASTILSQKISQVQGVGDVAIGGSSMPAVRVDINPMQLSAYGISVETVRQTISNANQLKPRGFIESADLRWQISTNGSLYKAEDFRNLVIRWDNGRAVRLGDVAHVYDGVESEMGDGFFNDKKAVLLVIRKQESANIIATVEGVYAQLPSLIALLPAQVKLSVAQDRTPSIRATLYEAELTLLVAIVLVVLVVLVFLHNYRATLIPAISVPLSLLGTFVVMYFMGFSLNNISLMALIVATGFVVDDSIVVVENIMRYLEQGHPPMKSALMGAKEVSFTVLSMSLSLVVVFFPLLMVGDLIGRLFYEFAITLSAAILVSMVVSLTVTPMLCALWLRPNTLTIRKKASIFSGLGKFFDFLLSAYKRSLTWVLRRHFLILLSLVAAIALNVYLFITVPKTLFPKQDTGIVIGLLWVDDASSYKSMFSKLEAYRKIILQDPNVETIMGYAGGSDGATSSFMMIQLKPFNERSLSADEVIAQLYPKINVIPGSRMFLVARQDIRTGSGRESRGDYEYMIKAGDTAILKEWSAKIHAELKRLPELRNVSDLSNELVTRVELLIDREAAHRYGVDMSLITNTLNDLLGKRQISVIYQALNQYQVVLGAAEEFTQDSSVLNDITAVTSRGKQVPLSAFAKFTVSNTPARVNQEDGMLAEEISFNLAPGVSLSQADAAIEKGMQRINLPTRLVQTSFSGDADTFSKMNKQQPLMILGVLALLYLVLGVLYESYIHPLTILSTLPSAGLGALLALLMIHMEFSIIALIGVFLLIGIVKKNAIIMIDFALHMKRVNGLSAQEAIYQACLVRFRPILMTTMVAIFGALPLILATGAGVEMRQPLGVTIVGGLIVSQVLTLYTTPVIYLYLDNLATKLNVKRHQTRKRDEIK